MALCDEEIKKLLSLNRAAKAKAAREALALFQQGLKPGEVCEKLISAKILDSVQCFPKESEFNPEVEFEQAHAKGIRILTWFDEDYPESLKAIENAPLVLYVRGELSEHDGPAVAVVGSREPSFYGREQALRLARELAQAGVTVVSGLARGVDEAAHQGCLAVRHGRTLAVLGCGVDRVYPRENQKLYDAITERGAVISEFPLATEPLSWNFPRRNRIISGLSLGVLVVEAHVRSGSLITARLAGEQGRQVFAVPGPVDQWTSRGTHQLLREGAVLVENAADILQDLQPVLKSQLKPLEPRTEQGPALPGDSEGCPDNPEKALETLDQSLMELLKKGPLTTEELLQGALESPQAVLPVISRLELLGQIQRTVRGSYSLTSRTV